MNSRYRTVVTRAISCRWHTMPFPCSRQSAMLMAAVMSSSHSMGTTVAYPNILEHDNTMAHSRNARQVGQCSSVTYRQAGYVLCAHERQTCTCPGGLVVYGLNNQWSGPHLVTDSAVCTHTQNPWGDPYSGATKQCCCLQSAAPTPAPTLSPSHAPTVSPTHAPTYAPTLTPTHVPTNTPTGHPCITGLHLCDDATTYCTTDTTSGLGPVVPGHTSPVVCACRTALGYHHRVNMTSCGTSAPTLAPTAAPTTRAPTTTATPTSSAPTPATTAQSSGNLAATTTTSTPGSGQSLVEGSSDTSFRMTPLAIGFTSIMVISVVFGVACLLALLYYLRTAKAAEVTITHYRNPGLAADEAHRVSSSSSGC
eukprot:m.78445 g.78445  ORF g.78445 m.78445 type:complete len:366 (-) comp9221_c0_seq1:242-1339(-)